MTSKVNYKLTTFGITTDILGSRKVTIECESHSVGELRQHLNTSYPPLQQLRSLFIAVNKQYASDDQPLKETDEIALIPPVSGG